MVLKVVPLAKDILPEILLEELPDFPIGIHVLGSPAVSAVFNLIKPDFC